MTDKGVVFIIAGALSLLIASGVGMGVYSSKLKADFWNQCNPSPSSHVTTAQMFWGLGEMLRIEEC
jgi:hypothetical protein